MKRQRGSILLWALLGLFVASAGAGIVYTYTSAIARAEKAEADAATVRAAHNEALAENQNLRMLGAQRDRLLAERQGARNAAADIERTLDAKLAAILQRDAAARSWGATPVPQSVVDGLRADPGGTRPEDRKAPAGGKPADPAAGRGVAGSDDQRGAARPR